MESAAPALLLAAETANEGYPLGGRCTSIGRSQDNDLVISDPYVSRYHARIWRERDGYRIEDLDALNGSFVNGERVAQGSSHPLNDRDAVGIGPTVTLQFEQPRTAQLGGRTIFGSTGPTMLTATGFAAAGGAPPMHDPLAFRPRRRGRWALKQAPSSPQAPRYVLRNEETGVHLQLTDRDVFLWESIDGQRTVRDLLLSYAERYGQLALPRIQQLLGQLRQAGLISDPRRLGAGGQVRRSPAQWLIAALTRAELAIGGLDGFLDRLYRTLGWRFFTRIGLTLVWLLVLGGFAGLVVAMGRNRVFDVGGAGALGAVLVLVGYVIGITVHELGHAIATKSYGRRVRHGGFMLILGMPYAFVDTTEMWFEGRWARVMVSAAGPIITTAMAGLWAIGAAVLPAGAAPGICFQVALGLYINTLFNLNPLITLDGYYAISDLLEMPRLRQEAVSYFMRGVWRDVAHRRFALKQAGLAVYGLAALIGTVGFLSLGIYSWNQRLSDLAHDKLPYPADQLAVYALLLLLFFPVWYPMSMAFVGAVRRRLRRGQAVQSTIATA